MTDEERRLLVSDLCGRIPYGVKVHIEGGSDGVLASVDWWEEVGLDDGTTTLYPLEDVKPYLRPMKSMTDEEKEDVKRFIDMVTDENYDDWYSPGAWDSMRDFVEYCNKRHLDFRGLIWRGLALEAREGMYEL